MNCLKNRSYNFQLIIVARKDFVDYSAKSLTIFSLLDLKIISNKLMYVYQAYNLGIHSELPFPELIPADKPPEVLIRLGKLPVSELKKNNGGDYFRGMVEGLGEFSVQEGREIIFEPASGVDESLMRPLILGPIMSILLRQRGLLVLHASSFAANGQAVAFMGESGWGKSTLVESFHSRGYSILTDDVMAIDINSSSPMVIPGFPQVKLWPDSANAIGHAPESLPRLNAQTSKLAHRLTSGFLQQPLPLKSIYVLAFGDHPEILPLQPQESFIELVRHSRAVNLLCDPNFVSFHFHQCQKLVSNISLCRLQRQRSLAALPEIIKLIEDDLSDINSNSQSNRLFKTTVAFSSIN